MYIIQTFDPNTTGPRRWQYAGDADTSAEAVIAARSLKLRFGDSYVRVLPGTIK